MTHFLDLLIVLTMTEQDSEIAKKATSKEALLEAGAKLFADKGYEAVSTRELAEAAGVNLGAIQYHFGSKERLFIETVQRLMRASGCARVHFPLASAPKNTQEAATTLCSFVFSFLAYLLRPEGPQACRLMIREIFSDRGQNSEMYRALVSSVVNEFSRPLEEMLMTTLRALTDTTERHVLQRLVQSILGQCTIYATHRPFIEELMSTDIGTSPALEQIAEHVCRFSLKGLGCPDAVIDTALANATENK